MAGDTPPNQLTATINRVYTLNEAVEEMKRRDRHATTTQIQWVSVRTGKRVYIGYNN